MSVEGRNSRSSTTPRRTRALLPGSVDPALFLVPGKGVPGVGDTGITGSIQKLGNCSSYRSVFSHDMNSRSMI
eukprot:6844242-Lingulodinium_polyedra.AAC.2